MRAWLFLRALWKQKAKLELKTQKGVIVFKMYIQKNNIHEPRFTQRYTRYLRPRSSRANRRTVGGKQEIACSDLARGVTLTLHELDINTLECSVVPCGTSLPRVAGLLRTAQADLGRVARALDVARSKVVCERRNSSLALESNCSVVPSRVALHDEVAGLAVVRETRRSVVESNAVGDLVVRSLLLALIATTKLEAVAVALEVAEAPTVDAVAPCNGVDNGDLALKFPQVKALYLSLVLELCNMV